MVEAPFSWLIAGWTSAPRFRRSTAGEQEYLNHCAGRERLHHGAASRLDFRDCLAHFHPRNSLDLLPQRLGGVGKQPPVKVLDLGGTGGSHREGLLGR